MELSSANKERDFYLSKVDQSRAFSEIEKRMAKVCGLYTTLGTLLHHVNTCSL